MPELCQWVININYLAARLRQIYSKPAARFICMVKLHCHNLAVGLRQSSSKLAARSPLALPHGLFFGKGRSYYVPKMLFYCCIHCFFDTVNCSL